MAPLHRTTRPDILVPSFWGLQPERSWLTGVAIGGRHTVTEVTTIPTQRHTVALTTATVITTARLIMTTTPAPMAGMGVLMARTDLRIGVLVTILTQAR